MLLQIIRDYYITIIFGIFSYFIIKFITRTKILSLNIIRNTTDRDRYHGSKIPDNIDTIVIGSGIGGLSTAAFLARKGQRVLVLEQHYIAGGGMHSFEDHGVEHETGIHYIGNIEKRKPILDSITDKPIEWCKMGKDNDWVYDEIVINNKIYKFRAGTENFITDLVRHFPDEEINIRNYISLVKTVSQKDLFFNLKMVESKWLQKIGKYFISKDYYKYVNKSAYDVISTFTDNEELKAVLGGQFGDYGPTPKKANFFIHASIVNHYLEGGYYPKGGTSVLTKGIIPTIEKNGGRVLVNKAVKNILIENDVAYGVELDKGERIYAKNIVSSIGIKNTFNKLTVGYESKIKSKICENYRSLCDKIGDSTTFVYLFVNLEGNPDDLDLRSSNIWVWPNQDYDKMITDFEEDYNNNPMPMFIACSCAKDYTWSERYPNKSNAIILTIAKKEWFEQWEDQPCTKRDESYKCLKDMFAQRMLTEGLYKYYPKTEGKVTNYDIGTPLTNQFYLGAYSGEAYGLNCSNYRFSDGFALQPKTDIKNLYLTGQDITTLGFTGALMGGILTAHSILGYGNILDIALQNNIIDDLKINNVESGINYYIYQFLNKFFKYMR